MVVSESPPRILARRDADLARARRAADRLDPEARAARLGTRRTRAAGLGLLASAPAGRDFLSRPPHRALARGAPPASCPATGVAGGAEGRGAAAEAALSACLAALPAEAGDCGCRLVALDDLLLVPVGETTYASGVAARLKVPALGLDTLLVADAPEDGVTALRSAPGAVGEVVHLPEGRVRVRLATGAVFEGVSRAVGFRRGRLAERIHATDAEGRRLALLIGFPPSELAESAGAWLAWPGEG